jgi:hypothetical protein
MRSLLPFIAALALTIPPALEAKAQSTESIITMETQRTGALTKFVAKKKFVAEGLYPGATNEQDRVRYEGLVNELAARLQRLAPEPDTKQALLAEFRKTMPSFEFVDSEERDRFLDYLEELMSIFGVESSDGLLNTWRYGFAPKESLQDSNSKALSAMSESDRAILAKLESATSATIESKLRELLGAPQTSAGHLQLWFLNPQGKSAIGLFREGAALVLQVITQAGHLYRRPM